MVYSQKPVSRIHSILAGRQGFAEKNMFGRVSFLPNGKMCFGVMKDDLFICVGPKICEKALAMLHERQMEFGSKPMKRFVYASSLLKK